MAKFGNILKKLRKDRCISQTELAKALGLSFSAISMYERGSREPDFETLEAIADFFNVSMDYLLGKTSFLSPILDNNISKQTSDFTPHEQTVITQYRAKPHLQEAVDKLLDVPPELRPLPDEIQKDLKRELESITGTTVKQNDSK